MLAGTTSTYEAGPSEMSREKTVIATNTERALRQLNAGVDCIGFDVVANICGYHAEALLAILQTQARIRCQGRGVNSWIEPTYHFLHKRLCRDGIEQGTSNPSFHHR